GTLSLGYKKLMPRWVARKGFSGVVGNTSLDLRIRRFGFRVVYERDCSFSYWTDSIFFLEDRYGTGISIYPARFLRLDYDFTYARGSYPESIAIRLPDESYQEIKRKDSYRIHTAGVVIRLVRNTGAGIRIFYWERDSNISWVGRERWVIGGFLTYDF
ncbi:MAG: hypothetical protein ACOC57_07380, partial [Acidobacteriota bacterium]